MKSKKLLAVVLGSALVSVVAGYLAFKFSPWPSALLLRRGWDRGGVAIAQRLEQYVPAGMSVRLDMQYDPNDSDAVLDVFSPATADQDQRKLPTIVWVHGGSWISGSKNHVANYLKILASKGFTTVGVDYALAPGRTYPTPVKQVNMALGFVAKNAARLHVDPANLFLAGDSAGAQIAAQLANAITAPSYASDVGIEPSIAPSQLRGVLLHCGTYEVELAQFRREGVLWSYFGTKDFKQDPRISQFSVARHITPRFPPMFISSGNDDLLAPQSRLLADVASRQGVAVDALLFPPSYTPPVQHEFQFNLDSDAGRIALDRSVQFISDRSSHGEER
jgi:acetyl esterase/lipase